MSHRSCLGRGQPFSLGLLPNLMLTVLARLRLGSGLPTSSGSSVTGLVSGTSRLVTTVFSATTWEITTAALATAEREKMSAWRGDMAMALPIDYIPKQSLANATRYFTPQLKEYETLVLTAEDTLTSLEADIFGL